MSIIGEQDRLVRNQTIPTGVIDGEMVALDLDRGECFGMDRVGTLIWEMSAEPIRVATMIDRLAAEHGVDRATCAADVLPFLADLAEAGLVRVLEE